jgi:hypothetical protein
MRQLPGEPKPKVHFKQAAWFEQEELLRAKTASELCFTPDKPNPDLEDLADVCVAFFGNDCVSFVQEDSISFRLNYLPSPYSIHRAYLVPFHKAVVHWDDDRPAALLLIHPHDTQKSVQHHLHSKNSVLLELCKTYIASNTQSKHRLIADVEQCIADAKQLEPTYISPARAP